MSQTAVKIRYARPPRRTPCQNGRANLSAEGATLIRTRYWGADPRDRPSLESLVALSGLHTRTGAPLNKGSIEAILRRESRRDLPLVPGEPAKQSALLTGEGPETLDLTDEEWIEWRLHVLAAQALPVGEDPWYHAQTVATAVVLKVDALLRQLGQRPSAEVEETIRARFDRTVYGRAAQHSQSAYSRR